ncbi:hypothetical protein [Cupriavidus basilensis]|uniref:Uncharacterized protein n=1 Tax=Cupriavidus basilensis TaxID=68895 RepID=A0A643FKG9_9BURK|nr:hypothetical protein [Cupriavidus basilensis]QOT82082.1 hypothetical protein F7R26_038010 [Cupriavidus basilensis]
MSEAGNHSAQAAPSIWQFFGALSIQQAWAAGVAVCMALAGVASVAFLMGQTRAHADDAQKLTVRSEALAKSNADLW